MNKPVKMRDFFDSVHEDYDEKHTSHIDNGKEFYTAISAPILSSKEKVKILNIGCGTGLEFDSILKEIPYANIDCIDLSSKMLNQLKKRLENSSCTLNVFCASYLEFDYRNKAYNYIIASATLHHLLDNEKLKLYSKLQSALNDNGIFIVGDKYAASKKESEQNLTAYMEYLNQGIDVKSGQYHIDIPTTIDHEIRLLKKVGFKDINVIWQSVNYSIITGKK